MRNFNCAVLFLGKLQVDIVHLFLDKVKSYEFLLAGAYENKVSGLEGDLLDGTVKDLLLHHDFKVMKFYSYQDSCS